MSTASCAPRCSGGAPCRCVTQRGSCRTPRSRRRGRQPSPSRCRSARTRARPATVCAGDRLQCYEARGVEYIRFPVGAVMQSAAYSLLYYYAFSDVCVCVCVRGCVLCVLCVCVLCVCAACPQRRIHKGKCMALCCECFARRSTRASTTRWHSPSSAMSSRQPSPQEGVPPQRGYCVGK